MDSMQIMYEDLYEAYDRLHSDQEANQQQQIKRQRSAVDPTELPALCSFLAMSESAGTGNNYFPGLQKPSATSSRTVDGFYRMNQCRKALNALDVGGWKRSYHQRMFHEAYMAACARPFWKLDPPGAFARAHQKILDVNGWESLAQARICFFFFFAC